MESSERWVCAMNPDAAYSRCEVAEEALGEGEMEAADAAVDTAERTMEQALDEMEEARAAVRALQAKREEVEREVEGLEAAAAPVQIAAFAMNAKLAKAQEAADAEAAEAAAVEAAGAARLAEAAEAAAAERAAAAAAWTAARDAAAAVAREAGEQASMCSYNARRGFAARSSESNGCSTNDSLPRLGESEASELIEMVEEAKRGGNFAQTIHGWSVSFVLRPPGMGSRGDVYVVDPTDGEVIRSIVGLKRKLGLATPTERVALVRMPPSHALGAAQEDAQPSMPSTRRRRELDRPKEFELRDSRFKAGAAAEEWKLASESVHAAKARAEELRRSEEAACVAAKAAEEAHTKAMAAVTRAKQEAVEAARELNQGRLHVCLVNGCGERFGDAGALQRHKSRAHRAR